MGHTGNLGKRQVKAPKVHLADTGLAAHLLGLDERRLAAGHQALGPLLETFVVGELRKQAEWSLVRPEVFHFRTHAQREVDVVLEAPSGEVVGVEVKAGATLGSSDVRGLRMLRDAVGLGFVRGVVLYAGSRCVPFGDRLHALPLSVLWSEERH